MAHCAVQMRDPSRKSCCSLGFSCCTAVRGRSQFLCHCSRRAVCGSASQEVGRFLPLRFRSSVLVLGFHSSSSGLAVGTPRQWQFGALTDPCIRRPVRPFTGCAEASHSVLPRLLYVPSTMANLPLQFADWSDQGDVIVFSLTKGCWKFQVGCVLVSSLSVQYSVLHADGVASAAVAAERGAVSVSARLLGCTGSHCRARAPRKFYAGGYWHCRGNCRDEHSAERVVGVVI